MDENLLWKKHNDHVCKKLITLICAFRPLSRFIDLDMAKQLYYGYVYPHITYGIEIYGLFCQNYIKQ